jgi:hypothetical protein
MQSISKYMYKCMLDSKSFIFNISLPPQHFIWKIINIIQGVLGEPRCRIAEMQLPNKIQYLLFSALALYRRENKIDSIYIAC